MKYFIRSIKYCLFLAFFFSILIVVTFYTSNRMEGLTILDLFPDGGLYKVIGFFVVFSAIYPLLGFAKKEVYVTNIPEKKREIKELFENANFILEREDATSISFRHRNTFLRLMRMNEDTITVDFSGNPVIIDGLRKDVFRFARGIEYVCSKEQE